LAPVAGQSSSLAVVAGHPLSLTPALPPWPSKKTKHKSPPDCWRSEVLDMDIKGYVDLSEKSGNNVLVFYDEMVRGKVMVIALRRPFSKYY
jgi:hypothetical protein